MICAKNGLHLPQLFFAFLNDVWISIFRHDLIFVVDQMQGAFVQFQMNDAAFVIDRLCCLIFYGLGHIIDVNIVAEDFTGASILRRDRRTGKANIGRIGQSIPDHTSGPNHCFCFDLAVLFLFHNDLFAESVLPAMRFVGHDDDITPLGKRFTALLKLLHGGKNDAVCLSVGQQLLQVGAAFGVLRRLPQKVFTAGELPVKLVIQGIAVCDDDNSRAFHGLLQVVGVKDHRQRLSAALRMPEDPALSVCFGCVQGGRYRFLHGKILVVSCQDLKCVLPVHVKADEVLENIQKAFLLKDPLEEGIKRCVLRVFIAPVGCLPGHETVLTRRDGTSLRSAHVAHHADGIVNKQRRDFVHIVSELPISRRCVCLFAGRGLQLHHNQRKSIHEENHIRALFRVFNERPLIGDSEFVVVRMFEIHQINERRALLAVLNILHRYAVLQIVHENHVLLQQRTCFKIFQLIQCLTERVIRQSWIQPL